MKKLKILNKEIPKSNEEIIRLLLENRGIKTKKDVEEFVNPKIEDVTLDSVGIEKKEVKKSLDLIETTIKEGKTIIIYGDYDVDGICGTAILWETLYAIYKNVSPYIPHRINEGYGLSINGIDHARTTTENVGLIITVDNGIVANKAVDYAHGLGIKVIITDHHTKSSTVPKADVIVHTTEVCGTGVAWLLSQGIRRSKFKDPNKSQISNSKSTEENHLELVALATIADLVPLNRFNRSLVKFGIEQLKKTKRSGLLELFNEAKIEKSKIGTYEIGHIIAPRLNATGRITHALDALRLVCTKDKARAKKLALHLGEVNRERQQLTLESAEDAINKIKELTSKIENLLFVESEMYEQGVIGLIASRLVEEFYRPAIAISIGEKISKGSARSIKGVNVIELIRTSSDLLMDAGGHPMAAGFSIQTSKLEFFKRALHKKAKEIDEKLFERELTVDLELPFELISEDLYSKIQHLSPFGLGNYEPVFITHGVTIAGIKSVGAEGKHLKLVLQKDGNVFTGIYFRAGKNDLRIGDLVDAVYTLSENEWNGKRNIELKIKNLSSSLLPL